MKRALAALGAAALLLLLTACAPNYGEIRNKDFQAEYYTTEYTCYAYKDGLCTMRLPHQQHHPASWYFDLYASEDEHGWHQVSESTYNKYEIGDYYDEEKKKE